MVASRNPQTARFCWQYLQLEQSLDFPDGELLRDEAVQETIYQQLFAPNAPTPLPPARYRLRVLKELTSRIESAIEDWETHVRTSPARYLCSGLVLTVRVARRVFRIT